MELRVLEALREALLRALKEGIGQGQGERVGELVKPMLSLVGLLGETSAESELHGEGVKEENTEMERVLELVEQGLGEPLGEVDRERVGVKEAAQLKDLCELSEVVIVRVTKEDEVRESELVELFVELPVRDALFVLESQAEEHKVGERDFWGV